MRSCQVAHVYLASEFKEAPTSAASASIQPTQGKEEYKSVSVSESELASRVGIFEEKEDGTIWKTYLKGGNLYAAVATLNFELQPVTGPDFAQPGRFRS